MTAEGTTGIGIRAFAAPDILQVTALRSSAREWEMALQTIQTETGNESNEEQPFEPTLSKDELFEIAKNQRRRDVLHFLNTNGGSATLSDMSEYIAAKENDTDIGAISSSQRKRVYIGLYQCHLPKMASYGIIDFDKNRGTIEVRPTATLLEPYLDAAPAAAESHSNVELRLGMAVLIALLVVAGLIGLPLLSALPAAGWAIVSTVALLVFAGTEALAD